MKVSTKGRYALRLMVDLGVNGGEEKIYFTERHFCTSEYFHQISGADCDTAAPCRLVRSFVVPQGGYVSAEKQINIQQEKFYVRLREVLHRSRVWKHRKTSVSVIMTVRR